MRLAEQELTLTSFHSSTVLTTKSPMSASEWPALKATPVAQHRAERGEKEEPDSFESLDQRTKYLVPLCMTKSAPHLKGSCRGGGAKVASTKSLPLALWTLSAS